MTFSVMYVMQLFLYCAFGNELLHQVCHNQVDQSEASLYFTIFGFYLQSKVKSLNNGSQSLAKSLGFPFFSCSLFSQAFLGQPLSVDVIKAPTDTVRCPSSKAVSRAEARQNRNTIL